MESGTPQESLPIQERMTGRGEGDGVDLNIHIVVPLY